MVARYGSPNIQGDDFRQTFQLQRQLARARQPSDQAAMARALMQQGASTAPVSSPVEGLARALMGGLGGYFAGQEARAQDESESQMLLDMQGQVEQRKADEAAQLAQAGVPGFKMPMPQPVPGQAYAQPVAPAGGGAEIVPPDMLAPAAQPPARPVNAELIAALAQMGAAGNRTATGALPGFQFQYQDAQAKEREARQEALAAQREARMLAAQSRETFGQPVVEMVDGQPALVRYGNLGGRQIVPGATPAIEPPRPPTPTDMERTLVAAGYTPGTPEYQEIMRQAVGQKIAPRAPAASVTVNPNPPADHRAVYDDTGRLSHYEVIPGSPTAKKMQKEQFSDDDAAITAEQTTGLIDSLLQHPALRMGTGGTSLLLNRIPGTATYDFGQRVEQLQGRAFLQAFESLKGGGQITEVEGKKATQAIARLSTAQTETAFREALQELRDITAAARDRIISRRQPMGGLGGVPIPGSGGLVAEPPGAPVRVNSPEEARQLPSGTPIILPDGRQGRVP